MSQQAIEVSAFIYHGLKYINGNRSNVDTRWTSVNERRWSANYGASPNTCQAIWALITGSSPLPNGASFYHLLWGLLFLKTYMIEAVVSGMVGVDEQTYRKWVWIIIPRIAALKPSVVSIFIFYHFTTNIVLYKHSPFIQICLQKRFIGYNGSACLLSVDGTDFKIPEQTPFWSGWRSFKFNGPGLRYEVAVSIQTGFICWINGPFAPGPFPDINIFRRDLRKHLCPWERVEADKGYRGDSMVHAPDDHAPTYAQYLAKEKVRDRHETINKRLKEFGCLRQIFRHEIHKHCHCFEAVAVIVQLTIERGERIPYQVAYRTM